MQLTEIGKVIATRAIYKVGVDKPMFTVKIGIPVKFDGSEDYYCPIQILGHGNSDVTYSAGIDGVQAIQLAMKQIGGRLFLLNKEHGGLLRWAGDENGDLGFPVPT